MPDAQTQVCSEAACRRQVKEESDSIIEALKGQALQAEKKCQELQVSTST